MLTGIWNANNMQRDKKLIKCLTQITCTHKDSLTHTQAPHTYAKPDRQRRFYPSIQTTETAPSDTYKFSKVPRICFGSEYNVPTTTIPAPPYRNDNFSIISDSLACFLIVNKIRLSVSASFPFFKPWWKRDEMILVLENESEILGVHASTEPKLDKFISTAECQRKLVEKEIE